MQCKRAFSKKPYNNSILPLDPPLDGSRIIIAIINRQINFERLRLEGSQAQRLSVRSTTSSKSSPHPVSIQSSLSSSGFSQSIPIATSMATLTMQPIELTSAAQEDSRRGKKPEEDGSDLSDIDSGWVVLRKSDIVSADLAAAAATRGGRRLRSSPTMPTWARWVLGGVVYTVAPFYKRIRHVEDETVGNVETAVEVVVHIAEVTEKLAANVADQLPEDGSLQKAAEKVEYIAETVDNDVEKVEAIVKKIEKFTDKIDAEVEPVIKELEKELKQNPTSYAGVNAQI